MMTESQQYTPGPASAVELRKGGEKWTFILVRELHHPPEKVWKAITDPAHVREWAPYDADRNLGHAGTVKLTWLGAPGPMDVAVTRAEAPTLLEIGDFRWELEPNAGGTRLTLLANIDRRYVATGAAGWHICLDVLEHALDGAPIARIAGPEAMKFEGWQRLNAEYGKQFGLKA